VIDVAQKIKRSVPSAINYPLLILMHSLKVNILGCILLIFYRVLNMSGFLSTLT